MMQVDTSLPTFANISGGRTSGYMASLLKDSGCTFLFQNTGRERKETYEFLKKMDEEWGLNIIWLEYSAPNMGKAIANIVSYETANRDGKPFEELNAKRRAVPNKAWRFCTQELKIKTGRRYIRSLGIKKWNNYIGFRADEPNRVKDLDNRDQGKTIQEFCYAPLSDRDINIRDIALFWKNNDFDIDLPMMPNGKTIGGNCKGCFHHSEYQQAQLCKDDPEDVDWLIGEENKYGHTFNKEYSYTDLREHVHRTPEFAFDDKEHFCMDAKGSCGR